MYARTNRCYNERGSRTNYVRSSIPHCVLYNYKRSLRMGLHIMYKKKFWGKRICFHKNIDMIQTMLSSVIFRLVCGCYGKECTLILRVKRRRQLQQSAGRDRLHLFQQQKYLSRSCTRKCRPLVALPVKCGNGFDTQHESGKSARTILSGNLNGKRSCIAEQKTCMYYMTFWILCPHLILF